MKKIPLNEIDQGMKVGKTVTDEQGLPLVKEGKTLDETIIKRLQNRDIDHIWIVDPDPEQNPKNQTQSHIHKMDQKFQQMIERFGREKDLLKKIKDQVISYMQEHRT